MRWRHNGKRDVGLLHPATLDGYLGPQHSIQTEQQDVDQTGTFAICHVLQVELQVDFLLNYRCLLPLHILVVGPRSVPHPLLDASTADAASSASSVSSTATEGATEARASRATMTRAMIRRNTRVNDRESTAVYVCVLNPKGLRSTSGARGAAHAAGVCSARESGRPCGAHIT